MPRKKIVVEAPKPLFVPDVNELKRRMNKKPTVVVRAEHKVDPKASVEGLAEVPTPKRRPTSRTDSTAAFVMETTVASPLKLRFGTAEEEGFVKMKQTWDDQVVVSPPWHVPGDDKSIVSETVEQIFWAWYYHRLDLSQRWAALQEAYRVLRPGGQLMIVSPYWSSRRAVADPLAKWPPVVEESFYVASKAWREGEGIADMIPMTCDFASVTPQGQLVVPSGHIPDPEVAQRNEEYRQHASRHFINSVWELHVTLTKVGDGT